MNADIVRPKIPQMPNLSAHVQKFWISMKKGFIGRPFSVVQYVNSNDKKKRTLLRYENILVYFWSATREHTNFYLGILIWSLNLSLDQHLYWKKIVKRRCVNWSPPDFEESLGRFYFITSNKKYTVEIQTCILKHQDETLKTS